MPVGLTSRDKALSAEETGDEAKVFIGSIVRGCSSYANASARSLSFLFG